MVDRRLSTIILVGRLLVAIAATGGCAWTAVTGHWVFAVLLLILAAEAYDSLDLKA